MSLPLLCPPAPLARLSSLAPACSAEFRVWHEGEDMFFLMFERDDKGQQRDVRVDSFPVASELLNELMGLLREHVRATPVLRHKLFQVGGQGVPPRNCWAAFAPRSPGCTQPP